MKKILATVIFASLTIGLHAQCDSVIKIEDRFDPHVKLKPDILPEITIVPSGEPAPDTTRFRRIYFIHGLGGSSKAWAQAALACQDKNLNTNEFHARKCKTSRPDYSDNTYSLYDAANDTRDKINTIAIADSANGMRRRDAIIIAHSQGGVVTRELMHVDMVSETDDPTLSHGMNYGGVVTIASPLQGARILNNRPLILSTIKSGCERLAKGQVFEANQYVQDMLPAIVKTIVGTKKINNFLTNIFDGVVSTVCDVGTNTVLKNIFFNEYYDSITSAYTISYNERKNMINTLNQDSNTAKYRTFPKIAFYAVEPQENILWRTLTWIANDPNKEDPFQANNDWKLYDEIVKPKLIDYYQAKMMYYYNLHQVYENDYSKLKCDNISYLGGKIPEPQRIQCLLDINGLNITNLGYLSFNDGLLWLYEVNSFWRMIIGARRCTTTLNPNYNPFSALSPRYITTCEEIPENDGIVLAESASNLPCATHLPVEVYPNKGTNEVNKGSSHMQVRNDKGLQTHLEKLFNGDYGNFFRTDKR